MLEVQSMVPEAEIYMREIQMLPLIGSFGENKDRAREIRIDDITPILESGGDIVLDFEGVGSVTQGFIHVLISDPIRKYGSEVLDHILFKNCSDDIRKIIEIVVDYMQPNFDI